MLSVVLDRRRNLALPRGRPIPPLTLTDEEHMTLEEWTRRSKTGQALALRSRIILGCAAGKTCTAVASELQVSQLTVRKWRWRFLKERLDGLLDEPRPGAPRKISDADVERVLTLTLETTPRDSTHWSTRSMAAKCGFSRNTVHRIWRAFGLQPHRTEAFKLSSDPLFIEKVRDIVGLYMSPPDRAMVLCVDEKSQIQALDRTRPLLPMRPGQVERRTHDYARHGTTTLFAALDARTGKVIGQCQSRHRSVEFRKFLDKVDGMVPAAMDAHLNGQLRNPQDHPYQERAGQTSTIPRALHSHECFMAQLGRTFLREADGEAASQRCPPQHEGFGGRHLRVPPTDQ